ncbi:PKD domain-containing protein [Limisalsivibrio acetivorans]|uniref:PKD domain-containing protein n=1 Tax=Limisalsivibrio acetivorans TaxID=1304888 RepID=UPI0003B684EB|nr:PKD domain-containing protein [Limisalsivibrio acetivorans]
MKKSAIFRSLILIIFTALALSITACGGGSGSDHSEPVNPDPEPVTYYSIYADVNGLLGEIEISNGKSSRVVSGAGEKLLGDTFQDKDVYGITVTSQPEGGFCSVENGAGTIEGADVRDVVINCFYTAEDVEDIELDSNDSIISVSDNSIVIKGDSELAANITEGTILCSQASEAKPFGSLLSITGKEYQEGNYVLSTEPAELTDMYNNAGMMTTQSMSNAEVVDTQSFQGGSISVHRVRSAGDYCSGVPTDFYAAINDVQLSDGITINGCYGFSYDLELDFDIEDSRITSFDYSQTGKAISAVDIHVDGAYSNINEAYDIGEVKFKGVLKTDINIPYSFIVGFTASVKGTASGEVYAGVGSSVEGAASVQADQSGIEHSRDFSHSFERMGPELTGDTAIDIGVMGNTSLKLFDVNGISLNTSMDSSIVADTAETPWWSMYGSIDSTTLLGDTSGVISGFGLFINEGAELNSENFQIADELLAQSDGGIDTNDTPEARFSYSPLSPQTDTSIVFTNESSDPDGDSLMYLWDFGDNYTSTEANPVHSFSDSGTYTVTLTAEDPDGLSDTESAVITVTAPVYNTPPEASFSYSPEEPETGEEVSFTNTSTDTDNDTLTYLWDLGDGTTETAESPSHTYIEAGTYTVVLEVSDGEETDTEVAQITVTSPEPVITVISPNGGESIEAGEALTIEWISTDYDGLLDISLVGDNITEEIAYSQPSSGSYEWVVPESIEGGDSYKVKVMTVTSPDTLYDYSDGSFSITEPAVKYSVEARFNNSGSVTPETAVVVEGERVEFVLVPNDGCYFVPTASGTCGAGTFSGNTYTTDVIMQDCWVAFSFVEEEEEPVIPESAPKLKKTGQTTSYADYDDGWYQAGVEPSYSRANDIVTDEVTGLMWQDDADASSINKDWQGAIDYCDALSLGGYSDWRLPSIEELETIVDLGRVLPSADLVFQNVGNSNYWSSTTYAYDGINAWIVNFVEGKSSYSNKSVTYRLRCVRSGE